jgi:hypothetical protein
MITKYEKVIYDTDLIGIYKVWEETWENTLWEPRDYAYVAKQIDKLFMVELKKRKLTKGRFLTAIRKTEVSV